MKFDVVIGNPPYNNDLYLEFAIKSMNWFNNTGCMIMITPAKWYAKGGQRNNTFRDEVLPHAKQIVYFRDTRDIFDIAEASGISYYLVDKNIYTTKLLKFQCNKSSVYNTDYEEHTEESLILQPNKIVNIIKKCTQGETIENKISFDRCVFVGEQERGREQKQSEDDYQVMQGDKPLGFVSQSELFTQRNVDKWKCVQSCMPVIGSASIFYEDGKTLGSNYISILSPNQVPKGSFQLLSCFDTEQEALNFKAYMMSKLVSLLMFAGYAGITVNNIFYRYVPNPNNFSFKCIYADEVLNGYTPDENGIYTDNSGNTHCSLYDKYKLTLEERQLINSIIKERKETYTVQ